MSVDEFGKEKEEKEEKGKSLLGLFRRKKLTPAEELQNIEKVRLEIERDRADLERRRLLDEMKRERQKMRDARTKKWTQRFDKFMGPSHPQTRSYSYTRKKKEGSRPEDGFKNDDGVF